MRICVNGTSVVTGGGLVNLRGLLHALATIDTRNEYLVLTPEQLPEPLAPDTPSMRAHRVPRHPGGALVRVAWEQTALPGLLRNHGIDLLFSPANLAPLRLPPGCRSVVKVQNIAPFDVVAMSLERGGRRKGRLRALRSLTTASLRRADAAIFISAASMALVPAKPPRSEVIYDGLTTARPAPSRHRTSVLAVADLYPHKNLEVLLRGYALLPGSLRATHPLVVLGRPIVRDYAGALRRLAASLGIEAETSFVPGASHAALAEHYTAAAVYCLPSRVEAGGTTLVEAMAAGAPVVAADLPYAREFCAGAALHADPLRPGEWASAIAALLTGPERVRTLSEAGQARAESFTWDSCARQTLALLESVGR